MIVSRFTTFTENFLVCCYQVTKICGSRLSPTESVKRTSPDTENHDKNGYAKVYDDNNLFMTNVDNCDTTYTDKYNNTKYNVRNM